MDSRSQLFCRTQTYTRTVLLLYNCTWYHHELRLSLIPHPHSITYQKLFGSYLHDISCHAAPQFELVSLRSCNKEFEERLFAQVRRVVENCTNRQPQNILSQVFLRLQVLLSQGNVNVKETKLVRAARDLKPYGGTSIPKEFIATRRHSWQVHLRRISPYLSKGEGVWWTQSSTAYHFKMAKSIPTFINRVRLRSISGECPGSSLMIPKSNNGRTS